MVRWIVLAWVAFAGVAGAEPTAAEAQLPPQFHMDRRSLPGGAELLTVYGHILDSNAVDSDVPLLAILRACIHERWN